MTTRNLLFHITPIGNWGWNLEQLVQRIDIFNGVKIFAVVEDKDKKFESFEKIKNYLQGWLGLNCEVLKFKNDIKLRETVSLLSLLENLKQEAEHDSITFYGHTKGVTHVAHRAVKLWTEALYKYNLDAEYLLEVERLLTWFPVVGSMKRYGRLQNFPPNTYDWHYSGTFFWFRNEELFKREWEESITPHRYGTEAYLSFMYTPIEAGVVFGDGVGDLYDLRYTSRLLSGKLKKWQKSVAKFEA